MDYTPGPYLVTFRRYSRTSNEFSVPITKDGDDIYTGNKDFNLTIVGDSLPLGLVPGDIISVKVTIVDDECKYIAYYVYSYLHNLLQLPCTHVQLQHIYS